MYIIEKIAALFIKFSRKEKIVSVTGDDNEELEDVITCKHNFMPVDSTGEVLACSKCGYLVTRKRLKNKKI